MQGRLSPPVGGRIQGFPGASWAGEFPLAARAGLGAIEWIFDVDGLAENPLATGDGPAAVAAEGRRHGVEIRSVCADYFMERPLVRHGSGHRAESRRVLLELLLRAAPLGATRLVLPFVDASSLADEDEWNVLADLAAGVLAGEASAGVELHLETDLGPDEFARLLERLPDPRVKVNYDSGNSAALGYRPRTEFSAYGPRIGSFHVKDRLRGGGTVALGTGDTDFDELALLLAEVGYAGDFVLQAARGAAGDELAWSIRNRGFVEERLLGGLP